jgi:tetratricopeptide (TPR) repeat protein
VKRRSAKSAKLAARGSKGLSRGSTARAAGWTSDLRVYALIFCATLAEYWPALHGTLLWDDSAHVTPSDLQSLQGLWRIWLDRSETQQYYPLLHTAFWIEHQLWGDAVTGYHLVNVLLHSLSACLVVMIVRNLRRPGAILAGFLFALHPICVEAVAWISEQKSTLSAVFYLAAALAYIRFDQNRRRGLYVLASGLFVLALLSKTVTATLPAALLVVLWWQKGRLVWRRDVAPMLPLLAVGAAAGLFTAWVERTDIGAQGAEFQLSAGQRCLIAGRALWFYLSKLVWPYKLTFIYPRWDVSTSAAWQYLFPIAFLGVLIVFIILARRGGRGPLAALLYFTGTLFPVLGFLNVYPFVYSFVADHFQYLASLAVIVPAAILLTRSTSRLQGMRAVIIPASVAILLGVLTWRQSRMYRDPEVLYRTTIDRNPGCWMAYNNLGNYLAQLPGRSGEARRDYEAAVRIKPDYAEAHYDLANLLFQDDLTAAIGHYEAAVRARPDFAEAHANLGTALARVPSRVSEAVTEYKTAIRLKPGFAVTHYDLANALSRIPDRLPEAIAEYKKAIELDPEYFEAHYNLGNVFARGPDHLPEAAAEYQALLRIKPDFLEAHISLGGVLARIPGRLPDAIAEFEAALRLNPDSEAAHYNLALALAKVPGRSQEAIPHLEFVLRARPDLVAARQLLERLQASGNRSGRGKL